MRIDADEIERALRDHLPEASPAAVSRLVKLLRTTVAPSQADSAQVTVDHATAALVRQLADHRLELGSGTLSFGSLVTIEGGSQIGDVTFGDMAGQNIYKVTLNLSQPLGRSWLAWALLIISAVSLTLISVITWQLSMTEIGQGAIGSPAAALTPEWGTAPLWLQLPAQIELEVAAAPACAGLLQGTSVIEALVEALDLGKARVEVHTLPLDAPPTGDPQWLRVEQRCAGSADLAELTIRLSGVARPIPLLNEPALLQASLPAAQADSVTQAAVLYSLGASAEAHTTLKDLAPTWGEEPDISDLHWLWGNILLREEDWAGAREAYGRALRSSPEAGDPRRADLLANRALARFFPGRLGGGGGDGELCAGEGRADLEEALGLDDRAAFHVLLGRIALHCPRDDDDTEQNAPDEAQLALTLDPDLPIVQAFQAELGNLDISADALQIERAACQALQAAPDLADGFRELGVLFAAYGKAEQARSAFAAYGRAAVFRWQRAEALRRVQLSQDPAPRDPPPGLGAHCPTLWQ